MEQNTARVGVFDSGIGGLTVLSACRRIFPSPEYLYYGDNPNAPYGAKSEAEILRLVRGAVGKLCEEGVDAVVLACNTATAVCAEALRSEFSVPIIGMEPAVKPAAATCKRVLVLATPRTAESERLRKLVSASAARCDITVHAAPRLAGCIERALSFVEPLRLCEHLPQGDYDGVVLGCTHYVYMTREIGDFYRARVFDGNEGAANRLRSLLGKRISGTDDHPINRACFGGGEVIFLGNGAETNKKLYNTNKCFIKF